MTWYMNGKEFVSNEEILNKYVGFVYCITEKESGMKYIGKKLFHRSKTLPKTKTRKRKKKVFVEDNWQDYYGSSKALKERYDELGPEGYHREILHLCETRGECSYMELREQMLRDVLYRDDYYNGIIQCRINSAHLKKNNNA